MIYWRLKNGLHFNLHFQSQHSSAKWTTLLCRCNFSKSNVVLDVWTFNKIINVLIFLSAVYSNFEIEFFFKEHRKHKRNWKFLRDLKIIPLSIFSSWNWNEDVHTNWSNESFKNTEKSQIEARFPSYSYSIRTARGNCKQTIFKKRN